MRAIAAMNANEEEEEDKQEQACLQTRVSVLAQHWADCRQHVVAMYPAMRCLTKRAGCSGKGGSARRRRRRYFTINR